MRYDAGKSWRRGIKRQETRRGGYSLLYCIVAQSLDPEQCTDEVGNHDADPWFIA